MLIDHTTLEDLSIFNADENQSVFSALDYTLTVGGKHWLRKLLANPHKIIQPIIETQQTLKLIIKHHGSWPFTITNGTIMVLERLYESQVDDIPQNPNVLSAWQYKLLHGPDYSLTKYTVGHVIDFLRGLQELTTLFNNEVRPPMLDDILQKISLLTKKNEVARMAQTGNKDAIGKIDILKFGHFVLYKFKSQLFELIDLYSKLDAYYSLATAVKVKGLQFPHFVESQKPYISADKLYHILLSTPVPYQLEMNVEANFVFLTGANMAGKSTFIKAVGLAVYLAHLGMGVPAQQMKLSLFNGMLSNINVSDNISKGESYFFNEVQRVKNTIVKINDGQKWLVLIDELFKGTNVQDAMRCSSEVIKGLLKIKNSLFILSTHLYEIGDELKEHSNIAFRYFATEVQDEQLSFSYELKEGISNDRLGYLILKREGVVEMLNKL